MTAFLAAASVFIAASIGAGVIAWIARPRPEPFFFELGGVPAHPGLVTRGGASGIGDLADTSRELLSGGCTRSVLRRPGSGNYPAGAVPSCEAS